MEATEKLTSGQAEQVADNLRLDELDTAYRWSASEIQQFRDKRLEFLRQYVGTHYGPGGADHDVPINMQELYVHVMLQQLISGTPQVLLHTNRDNYLPVANMLRHALNEDIVRMNLRKTGRRVAKDAIFGFGCAKVGLRFAGYAQVPGLDQTVARGETYVSRIHPDDWVHDMAAEALEECDFFSDRARIRWEDFMESPLFTNKDDVQPDDGGLSNTLGGGGERASTMQSGSGSALGSRNRYHKTIEIRSYFLTRERLVVMVLHNRPTQIVGVAPYAGYDHYMGPYRMLSFNDVPDNTMPLSPLANLLPLHGTINTVMRRMMKQAMKAKRIHGYKGQQGFEDAQRVYHSDESEFIKMTAAEAIEKIDIPGPSAADIAYIMQMIALFDKMAGGLSVIGGLGSSTPTAAQDQLLYSSASQRVAEMQHHVLEFFEEITRDMAYWLWTDPVLSREIPIPVPGVGTFISRLDQNAIMGRFFDYTLSVEPHSLRRQTPQERLQSIFALLERIIIPLFPLAQQQGLTLNLEKLVRLYADYTNTPEVLQALDVVAPGNAPTQMPESGAPTPSRPGTYSPPAPEVGAADNAALQSALAAAGSSEEA